MKKLFLAGAMLVWSGGAYAQNSQCSSTEQGAPDIERIDVSTVERPSETSAVVQLDVVATTPNGATPTYSFTGGGATLANEGPRATWTVNGAGSFTATIRVSSGDCVSNASVTFTVEEQAASDEEPAA